MNLQSIQKITLDTVRNQYINVTAKAGDVASRFIHIQVTNAGDFLSIDKSKTVVARIMTPDNRPIELLSYEMESFPKHIDILDDGTIMLQLSTGVLLKTGEAKCDIEIKDNDIILSTFTFRIHIVEQAFSDDEILSDPEAKSAVAILLKEIKGYVSASGESANNAKTSEANAKKSETNAKSSETKAKTSETNAKTSETNAKSSETKAKTSETNAKTSETNAKNSETNAKTSETNASASATTATQKATAANTSASNAKTSETNAKVSETNAKTSETNAKTSETNAGTSESKAKTSETNAKASQINAKTSEINAKNSETNAKVSEDNSLLNAKKAESHSHGGVLNSDGTPFREGQEFDNAKYYSELSKQSALNVANEVKEELKEYSDSAKQSAIDAKKFRDDAESITHVEIATNKKTGIVKPDGITITVDDDGTLHGADTTIALTQDEVITMFNKVFNN